MGFWFSKLNSFCSVCLHGPPVKVVLLGLSNSGKTTSLYRLKLNETVKAIPTCGFNVEEITAATGMKLTVWDVGGGKKLNKALYCNDAEGLIFVVDSSDQESFKEARDELKGILDADTTTRGIPFVVMANKQDQHESVDPSKLIESLRLRELNCNKWTVQRTCATTGQGLHESVEVLIEMIKSFRKEKR